MTDYWIDNVRIENGYTYDNDWVNGSKTDLDGSTNYFDFNATVS